MRTTMLTILLSIALASSTGCGDDSPQTIDAAAQPDAGTAVDASCFTAPQTHDEIINACTSAQTIDKVPVTPLQYADGGLPPLPP